jgi:hypothetical protein
VLTHRRLPAAVLLAAVSALALAAPAAAASHHKKAAPPPAPSHKLLLQGNVVFWECPAKTTKALVGVNSLTLHPGNTLTINFIVRNTGALPCNYVAPYAGVVPGPTAPTLQVGPCGSMGFEIEGARHRNVWPGLATFNCPALGFAQMAPDGTVVGSGSWSQTSGGGTKRVAPGSYTLVVDGRFAFALKVAAH